MSLKPVTLEDCLELSHDAVRLREYLRARLVQLTTSDASVAIKAIELLLSTPADTSDDSLADVPTSVLLDYRNRARELLKRRAAGSDNSATH